jgi:hypothetical protein
MRPGLTQISRCEDKREHRLIERTRSDPENKALLFRGVVWSAVLNIQDIRDVLLFQPPSDDGG